MTESTISLVQPQLALSLFGAQDQNLRTIRETFDVTITHRDGQIRVAGDESSVTQATAALEQLKKMVELGRHPDPEQVSRIVAEISGAEAAPAAPIEGLAAGRKVVARTPGQHRYIEAIRDSSLVIAIGPAGTGKTYLAVALAVEALRQRQIRKIVLVRPAVEAGESLGFLPGDLQAKINPYLRPLLDALNEMIDYDQIKDYMERDIIEVVPLAYMRGRTLNDAFIILDEGQNATVSQMKMFLTRMGEGSKIVCSGDVTQVDLPPNTRSGLTDALDRLSGIRGITAVKLTQKDIVRHPLVQAIVNAYDAEQAPRRKKAR